MSDLALSALINSAIVITIGSLVAGAIAHRNGRVGVGYAIATWAVSMFVACGTPVFMSGVVSMLAAIASVVLVAAIGRATPKDTRSEAERWDAYWKSPEGVAKLAKRAAKTKTKTETVRAEPTI